MTTKTWAEFVRLYTEAFIEAVREITGASGE
jgi:hypothetical protein